MKTKNASVNCRNTLFLLFCIDAEIICGGGILCIKGHLLLLRFE